MKSPFTGGEVRIVKELQKFSYRYKELTVMYQYYVCEDTGEHFTTDKIDNLNIAQVYKQYLS